MKKGISNVVAVILVILITVFLITMLWVFGIDFIKTQLDGVDRTVRAYVVVSDGYTICDYGKNLVSVQVELKGNNEAVNRIKLIFNIDGDSYSKVFDAPSANGKKVYIINISDEFGMDLGCPSGVKAIPIFDTLGGEVEGDASKEVEVVDGIISDGAVVSLSPPTPTCSDGIQNGLEEGVDCGGACAACSVIPPTCSDGIQNQGEVGIDCGGPCAACAAVPNCSDGIQNQGEVGIDCGGPCAACAVCSLTGAFWDSGSISLGDDVVLSIASSDCSGNYNYTIMKNVPLFPDDEVYSTIEDDSFTWTPTEEGTYYFEVVDVEGISSMITSLDLEVIDEPVIGTCSINGAFWSDTSVGVGIYVDLSIVSSDCSGTYDYTIMKKRWFIIPDDVVGLITTVSPFSWAPSESGTYYFKAIDAENIGSEVTSGEMVAT